MKKILIMGLPGSGKTTLAEKIVEMLPNCVWFNADDVRKQFDDWDFSEEGRIRQAHRMRLLADNTRKEIEYVVIDMVAPLPIMRDIIDADYVIWMDTIEKGRFEDTNKVFVPPADYDHHISEMNSSYWASKIAHEIIYDIQRPVFDWNKPTVQMLGRWQPWHKGHRSLFDRLIEKTGQVCIMIRDCQGWNGSNPFNVEEVKRNIRRDLDGHYQGMYEIIVVPNIVHIGYGRSVGYTFGQEVFSDEIHDISATKIRKEMGYE